jgi:hypothetical protein
MLTRLSNVVNGIVTAVVAWMSQMNQGRGRVRRYDCNSFLHGLRDGIKDILRPEEQTHDVVASSPLKALELRLSSPTMIGIEVVWSAASCPCRQMPTFTDDHVSGMSECGIDRRPSHDHPSPRNHGPRTPLTAQPCRQNAPLVRGRIAGQPHQQPPQSFQPLSKHYSNRAASSQCG